MPMISPSLSPDLTALAIEPIVTGLNFVQQPCYRQGFLYVSDLLENAIWEIDVLKKTKRVWLVSPERPNGCGFLSDGTLVFGLMFDAKLMCVKDFNKPRVELYSNLDSVLCGCLGDMAIDAHDNVYINDIGPLFQADQPNRLGNILVVTPDRKVGVACENVAYPNGMCIDRAGRKLYLAETKKRCVYVFEFTGRRRAGNRRVWLRTADMRPLLDAGADEAPKIDSLAIDQADALWLGLYGLGLFLRVTQDGFITHRIKIEGEAATMIAGGEDGNQLFVCSNQVPVNSVDISLKRFYGQFTGTVYRVKKGPGNGHF